MDHRSSGGRMLLIHVSDDPDAPIRVTYGPVDESARTTVQCATGDDVIDAVRTWLAGTSEGPAPD